MWGWELFFPKAQLRTRNCTLAPFSPNVFLQRRGIMTLGPRAVVVGGVVSLVGGDKDTLLGLD